MKETITLNNKTITLIGTAHVSKESVKEVMETLEELRPDTVCVEICQSRYNQIKDAERWKNLDVYKVIKSGQTHLLLLNLMLSSYQRRIGDELGVRPGQEMISACDKAEEIGAKTVLADREVNVTLKRTWAAMSGWEKLRFMSELMYSLLIPGEEMKEENIENLKKSDIISSVIDQFGSAYPKIKETLIDERDLFMAKKISDSPGVNIVAVVGAGHLEGIKRNLGKDIDIELINTIPTKKGFKKYLKWLFPLLIMTLISYGFYSGGGKDLEKIIWIWVLSHSILAGLFCFLVGGTWKSTLVAIVSSPITPLNPVIKAGYLSGLTEAIVAKPLVSDIEELSNFKFSFANLKKNRFTKILLVLAATNIGSSLASIIGFSWITTIVS